VIPKKINDPKHGDSMTVCDIALAAQKHGSKLPPEVMRAFRDGVRLDANLTVRRLQNDDAKRIMDACEPCGFNFNLARQKHYYVIERTCPPDPDSYDWDWDQTILRAIAFSRWVHDSPFGFEYAARVYRTEPGTIERIEPLLHPPQTFWEETTRAWLMPDEWTTVGKLLAKWPVAVAGGYPRVERAIWYREHASREQYLDVRWVQLVTAIESLVSIWNVPKSEGKNRRVPREEQFRKGTLALARDCQAALSEDEVDQAWERRSELVHASGLPNPTNRPPEPVDPLYLRLQSVLDRSLQRLVFDDHHAENFKDNDTVLVWRDDA
jgi:hypothetical protein